MQWVKRFFRSSAVWFVLLLVAAYIGYSIGARGTRTEAERAATPAAAKSDQAAEGGGGQIWSCAMHPNVQLPGPGKCPICGMDLIPVTTEAHPWRITFSPEQAALAGIEVSPAVRKPVYHTVFMTGKIVPDERKIAYVTAWIPGRLDRLYVDFTGTRVRKGDHLVYIYSPELVQSQQQYLSALRSLRANIPGARETYEAVRDQLLLLGLTEEQIKELEKTGKPSDHVTIYSPIGGVVLEKLANEGEYVQEGSKIYTIADLSTVWVILDAYESDLPWVTLWQPVEFTTEAFPGEVFSGEVAFVDPVLTERTRTVRVRLNVPNESGRLRPGMFVRALLKVRLDKRGWAVAPDLTGKWMCPMHPEVVQEQAGQCPICGMELVRAEELGYRRTKEVEDPLVIPSSAVLWTGRRAVVYVQVASKPSPVFEGREVILGPQAGDYWVVLYGLREGDLVVTEGNFKIDASLQIKAKRSMMTPEGGGGAAPGHAHGGHGEHAAAPAATGAEEPTIEPARVPDRFRIALGPLYQQYLQAARALADDRLGGALEALRDMERALQRLPLAEMPERVREAWGPVQDKLYPALVEALDAKTLEHVRTPFREISAAMVKVVSMFGHALSSQLYQFHCPMVEGGGAEWLQTEREVRNPYYGARMLRCGELRATYEPIVPLVVTDAFRQQLSPIYSQYLKLVDAMRAEDLKSAQALAQQLAAQFERVQAKDLNQPAAMRWAVIQDKVRKAVEQGAKAQNIREFRNAFRDISAAMVELATRFGHALEQPLYVDHCPMVFRRQGAFWLQTERQIANPYAPKSMGTCGTITQVVPPEKRAESAPNGSGK